MDLHLCHLVRTVHDCSCVQAPGWLDRIHPCGKTLLRCAVDHRRHAVITSLVSAGASPTASDLYGGVPNHATRPRTLARVMLDRHHVDTMRLCLDWRVSLVRCARSHTPILALLLDHSHVLPCCFVVVRTAALTPCTRHASKAMPWL